MCDKPTNTTPLCGDQPSMLRVSCVLDPRHRGPHSSGDGVTWTSTREEEAVKDERQRILSEGSRHSGIDIDALPLSFDEWQNLDAEEKGAALEGYFAIVNTLWTGKPS